MNVARQQMAPIPKPNPPLFRGDEDPVTKLKKTTAVAVKEFETGMSSFCQIASF